MSMRNLALAAVAASLTLTWQGASRAVAVPEAALTAGAATAGSVGMIAYVDAGRIYRIHTDGSHRWGLADGAHPVWSPDGRQIAYEVWSRQWVPSIWVMSARGENQRELVPEGTSPAWSPDGQMLSFVQGRDLMRYHLADDTTEVVVAGTEEWPGAVSSTWSPDGKWIAFERLGMDWGDGSPHRLFRVRADGTSLQQVGNISCAGNPAWSPDGQRIAFGDQCAGRGSEETGDIWTVRPDGTGRRAVLRWWGTDQVGSWSPDGARLVVTSAGDWYPSQAGIWILSPDGTHRRLVVRDVRGWDVGQPSWRPRFSADPLRPPRTTSDGGQRIAYVAASDRGFDLFTVRPDGTARRQLTHLGHVTAPGWSPDHRRLAFFAQSSFWKATLWVTRDKHPNPHRVGVAAAAQAVSWSPDGRRLLWAGAAHGDEALVVYDVRTGTRRTIGLHGWYNAQSPSWSPDGRRIVLSAATPNGEKPQVAVVPVAGGTPHKVINLPGSLEEPSWSADGRRISLTWTYLGRSSVLSTTPTGRFIQVIARSPRLQRAADWSPSGRRLALYSDGPYWVPANTRSGLWTLDPDGRHAHFILRDRSIAYVAW